MSELGTESLPAAASVNTVMSFLRVAMSSSQIAWRRLC